VGEGIAWRVKEKLTKETKKELACRLIQAAGTGGDASAAPP